MARQIAAARHEVAVVTRRPTAVRQGVTLLGVGEADGSGKVAGGAASAAC